MLPGGKDPGGHLPPLASLGTGQPEGPLPWKAHLSFNRVVFQDRDMK